MDDLDRLIKVFGPREKPTHFNDYNHCGECREHDELLRKFSRENISFNELGNLAWNPISSANIEGFLYYLPALARLSLGQGDEYFADQFIIHVDDPKRLEAMTAKERRSLRKFMISVKETLKEDFEFGSDLEHWQSLIQKLTGQQ